jgi:hypothetical protein
VPCTALDHRYVYRRTEQLTAGAIYHYQMRNMRDVYVLQAVSADSVMYLVNSGNEIVARNDDYDGYKSEIIYRPDRSGTYTLIIRSYSFFSPGYCDLYRGVYGAQPKLVDSDVLFWGTTRLVAWSPGQIFETTNSTGDPFLIFLFADQAPGRAYFGPNIDDAGAGLNSRFVAPPFIEEGTGPAIGRVVLGSYSRYTQGECEFCQDDPSTLAPPKGDLSWEPNASARESIHGSQEMQQFAAQLGATKDRFEELEPAERDRKVAELRQRILSKDERRLQFMPPPEPTPQLIRSCEEYVRQSKELDQEPEGLLYTERFRRLEELETRLLAP